MAELDAKQIEALWAELTEPDAAKAHKAIVTLGRSSKQALPWLSEHLKPAEGVEAKRLDELITNLNSEVFAVRQKAGDELEISSPELGTLRNTVVDEK